jgi:PTS system mannitol-specific IIA component
MADVDPPLLDRRAIRLAEQAESQQAAIRGCGQALVDIGAVHRSYVQTMLDREESISTYLGEGVAIPHGTVAGKDAVLRDALAVLKFPDGVDWGGEKVTICIAIAARGDGHLAILTELAQVLSDPDHARELREATSAEDVLRLLEPVHESEESEEVREAAQ